MSTSTHYKLTIMSFKRRLIKIIQSGELKLLHTGRSMNNVDDRYLSSMSRVIRRIESEIEWNHWKCLADVVLVVSEASAHTTSCYSVTFAWVRRRRHVWWHQQRLERHENTNKWKSGWDVDCCAGWWKFIDEFFSSLSDVETQYRMFDIVMCALESTIGPWTCLNEHKQRMSDNVELKLLYSPETLLYCS